MTVGGEDLTGAGAVVGAIAGGLLGWIIAALFSSGPKTPMEALEGGYERSGVGCFGFLLLVGGGAVIGAIVGAALGAAG